MSLTGVHIEFGLGSDGVYNLPGTQVLRSLCVSSQTMATPGTSTIAASGVAGSGNRPVMSISSQLPIFFAVGPNPDATNGPRRYMDPANGGVDVFVKPGDKVAWILA